ncbi:MAG: hypothetical protein M5U12_25435 [Verrucomicrobia bacterium]|nr:hypothetical protein [Verrucomicrobiota bacterium]
MIGPHDLIVAATALQRRRAVATFNAREFRHVRGLKVVEPRVKSAQLSCLDKVLPALTLLS